LALPSGQHVMGQLTLGLSCAAPALSRWTVIGGLLKDIGSSLQANTKILDGGEHPDKNDQFEYI
jgi:hypothetical protein